jgi:metal-dependent hydrolase (beta-lactamase superfamily II)
MAETVAALRRFDVRRLGPVHCTGWAAIATFQREFPDRCFQWAAGMRMKFGPM